MGSRYHATHDSPKIFDDFLAAQLFTAEEHRTVDQQLAGQLKVINPERAAANPDQATALACVMQTHNGPITLSRSRYAEDQLIAAIASSSPRSPARRRRIASNTTWIKARGETHPTDAGHRAAGGRADAGRF